MVLSKIPSAAFWGLEAISVDVEVDVKKEDKFLFIIVGLPDAAVKESKDRVLAAIRNSQFSLGLVVCTVNLAPGDLKKEGPLYDLPIALALLQPKISPNYLCIGELGLSGETRPMKGALSAAILAKKLGKKGIILPKHNEKEAFCVPGIEVIGVNSLKEAYEFLQNPLPRQTSSTISFSHAIPSVDFADIKGQLLAKRALEIAAAGGHNVLLSGPPGSGKTLLSKALIGILPPLNLEEAIEVTRIHSFMGATQGIVQERPFRAPHHTISSIGLIGGGTIPRPGEVTLSHLGVLFLDELPEFARSTLEVLRQPLENKTVTISRARQTITFPTNFLFIAAMNPCPCGYLGHPQKPCTDSLLQVERYRSKISGPLLDRIDLHVDVPAVPFYDMGKAQPEESSSSVRERVIAARTLQQSRSGKTNSLLSNKELSLPSDCQTLMSQAMDTLNLSARGYFRILRVARTIADLASSSHILPDHIMEALSFRHQTNER